ncbi:MAG: adenylate kinase [Microgenomates group bacterium LiPW_16]|nr:MAG: adenylate kinase [Microgenomates group bacterium LiPW_16]
MKIIIMGIQGSGKSTQGNLLSKDLGVPYLSTGHIFRSIAQEKTKWGRYVKETLNAGILVPDEKVLPIVKEYLGKSEYCRGWILDGFPRTLVQARRFGEEINRVIYLKVSDEEALKRLAYRNDQIREDDTTAAVKKRIDLYHKVTEPVIDFYKNRGILLEIDGERPIEEIHQEILVKLTK